MRNFLKSLFLLATTLHLFAAASYEYAPVLTNLINMPIPTNAPTGGFLPANRVTAFLGGIIMTNQKPYAGFYIFMADSVKATNSPTTGGTNVFRSIYWDMKTSQTSTGRWEQATLDVATTGTIPFLVGPFQTYTTIQSAINAASSGRGILILSGTYNEAVTLKDGVDLTGFGQVIITQDGTNILSTVTDGNVMVRCSLKGVTITRTGTPIDYENPTWSSCNGLWIRNTNSVIRCVNVDASSVLGNGVSTAGWMEGVIGRSTKAYDSTNHLGGSSGIVNTGTIINSQGYHTIYDGIVNYSADLAVPATARFCYGESLGDFGKAFVNFGVGGIAEDCIGYMTGGTVWSFYNNGGVARNCIGVGLLAGGFVNAGKAYDCEGDSFGTGGGAFGFQTSGSGALSIRCNGRSVNGDAIQLDAAVKHSGGNGVATGDGNGVHMLGAGAVGEDLHGTSLGTGRGIYMSAAGHLASSSGVAQGGYGVYAVTASFLQNVSGRVVSGQCGIYSDGIVTLLNCSGTATTLGYGLILNGDLGRVIGGSYSSFRNDANGSAIYLATASVPGSGPTIENVATYSIFSGSYAIDAASVNSYVSYLGLTGNKTVSANVKQDATTDLIESPLNVQGTITVTPPGGDTDNTFLKLSISSKNPSIGWESSVGGSGVGMLQTAADVDASNGMMFGPANQQVMIGRGTPNLGNFEGLGIYHDGGKAVIEAIQAGTGYQDTHIQPNGGIVYTGGSLGVGMNTTPSDLLEVRNGSIRVTPLSDTDITLLKVGVTGVPNLYWKESVGGSGTGAISTSASTDADNRFATGPLAAQVYLGGTPNIGTFEGVGLWHNGMLGILEAIQAGTAWQDIAIAPSGGNVGIGTLTGLAKLSITGGVGIGTDANPGASNLRVEGKISIGGALTSTDLLEIRAGSIRVTPASDADITLLKVGVSNTPRIAWDESVSGGGSGAFTITADADSDNNFTFGPAAKQVIIGSSPNVGTFEGVGIYHDGNGGIIEAIEAGVAWQKLSLQPSGGVVYTGGSLGVGMTTTPSDKLEVRNGSIRVTPLIDTDITLIKVGVSNTPNIAWDESLSGGGGAFVIGADADSDNAFAVGPVAQQVLLGRSPNSGTFEGVALRHDGTKGILEAIDAAVGWQEIALVPSGGTVSVGSLTASKWVKSDANKWLVSADIVVSDIGSAATLTAGTGLTGTTAAALLTAAILSIDQSFSPQWTGQHLFDIGNVDFRNTAAYSTSPSTLLKGSVKYNAAGTYSTVAQMTMGKENATDGNNAGYWNVQTRPNGGSPTTRISVASTGAVAIAGELTAGSAIITGALNVVGSVGASSIAYTDVAGNAQGLGSTRGNMIVGGVANWTMVTIGTTGKYWRSDGTDPSWQTIPVADIGSGATLTAGTGLSGTTAGALLTAASLSIDQTFAPVWTGFHTHRFDSLGVTQDDAKGVFLYNDTDAVAGAQQISPAIRWRGEGWKTDATAASRTVDVRNWLLPVQGAANPSGTFKWQASINGGAYSDILTLSTAGLLTAPSAVVTGNLNVVGSVGATSIAYTDVAGNAQGLASARGTMIQGGVANWTTTAIGASGRVWTSDGTDASWQPATAGGTVTSVAMTVPSILSVAGSPITTSGTLAVTLATQSANTVFAGPASGGAATPAFRPLVAADLPDITSGVYTPTLENTANLTSSTAYECQYMRVGSVVTVSGRVAVDPTTTLTSTQLSISCPITTDSTAFEKAGGTAYAPAIAAQGAAIRARTESNFVLMIWMATDVTEQDMFFSFTYLIEPP